MSNDELLERLEDFQSGLKREGYQVAAALIGETLDALPAPNKDTAKLIGELSKWRGTFQNWAQYKGRFDSTSASLVFVQLDAAIKALSQSQVMETDINRAAIVRELLKEAKLQSEYDDIIENKPWVIRLINTAFKAGFKANTYTPTRKEGK